MHYPKSRRNGLPGGHINRNESPDDALVREFQEELGVVISDARRQDFFRHEKPGERIILGYTLIAPKGFTCKPTDPAYEHDTWVSRKEVKDLPNMSSLYRQFILDNWPKKTKA